MLLTIFPSIFTSSGRQAAAYPVYTVIVATAGLGNTLI